MKIFYFVQNGFDVHGPSNHLVYAHIAYFLKMKNSVFLLCSKCSEDPKIPEEFLNDPNFEYRAVLKKYVDKSKFALRYITSVKYVFDCRKYLKLASKYDVIYAGSSPVAPFVIWASKKYGKKPVVWNIQDMFPGSSIASGVMRRRWMQNVFTSFQKYAYSRADWITVISEDMKKKVMEQGVNSNKITPILNWFDDKSVKEIPWEENRFVKAYNMSKEIFYVQYAGTTGYVFDYKAVLYVANYFKINPSIRFQIIASGSQLNKFKYEAEILELSNIDFLPLQPQDMVSDVYSACSVCYIPLKYGVIGNSVPSKAGLLMACKRPVINSVDPGTYYYNEFNDNKIGISVSNMDYKESIKAIQYLFEHPEVRVEMGLRAYIYGKDRYSSTLNLKKYEDVFIHLI